MVVQDAAVRADQHIIFPRNLAGAALATSLNHRLRQRRETPHVVGKLPSGVGRQRTPGSKLAVRDKRTALPLAQKP